MHSNLYWMIQGRTYACKCVKTASKILKAKNKSYSSTVQEAAKDSFKRNMNKIKTLNRSIVREMQAQQQRDNNIKAYLNSGRLCIL